MYLPCRLAFTLTATLSTLPIASAQSATAKLGATELSTVDRAQTSAPETRQKPGTLFVKPQPGEPCFMMREYHFSRASDALKMDGASTWQTANAFQLKNAEAQGAVLIR